MSHVRKEQQASKLLIGVCKEKGGSKMSDEKLTKEPLEVVEWLFIILFVLTAAFGVMFIIIVSEYDKYRSEQENKPASVIECVFDKGGSAIYNIGKIKFDDGYTRFYPKSGDVLSSGFRIEDLNDMECVIK